MVHDPRARLHHAMAMPEQLPHIAIAQLGTQILVSSLSALPFCLRFAPACFLQVAAQTRLRCTSLRPSHLIGTAPLSATPTGHRVGQAILAPPHVLASSYLQQPPLMLFTHQPFLLGKVIRPSLAKIQRRSPQPLISATQASDPRPSDSDVPSWLRAVPFRKAEHAPLTHSLNRLGHLFTFVLASRLQPQSAPLRPTK
jgi:hypothetical protein